MSKHKVIALAGPTASGKTEAALNLAKKLNGEIIGADSVQIYKHFNIGAGKPKVHELMGIPHHLIDHLVPTETIDAASYAALADQVIYEVIERGKVPIVVGGTGLWLRALLRGLVALPTPDPAIRQRLSTRCESEGSPALHKELSAIDPELATRIHPNDALRVTRALEVYLQTGTPMGEHQRRHALGSPRYRHLLIVLDPPRPWLRTRIDKRVATMFADGFVDEVRDLVLRYGNTLRPLQSVGYRQILAALEDRGGVVDMEGLEKKVSRATFIYAKQQRTFMRGELGAKTTLDPSREGWEELALEHVRSHL